ncbi:unnamed protein product, partial [Oppiella nova]
GCEKTYCDARSLRRHKENHHPPGPISGQNPQSLQTLAFIPGIALNFSTANVGLTPNQALNRIQYAPPPPPPQAPVPQSISPQSVVSTITNTTEQSAATQLQRLALHKHDNNIHNQMNDKWGSRDVPTPPKWHQNTSVINKTSFANNTEIGKQLLKQELNHKMQTNAVLMNPDSPENALLHQLLTQSTHSPGQEHHFKADKPQQQPQPQPPPLFHHVPQHSQQHQQSLPAHHPHPQQQQSAQHPTHHNQQPPPLHPHHSSHPHHKHESSHQSFRPQPQPPQQSMQTLPTNESQPQQQPHQQQTPVSDNWPYTMFSQNHHKSEPQQVECSLCQRKFKNIPALNGHMRLHGGYLKNQSQNGVNTSAISSTKKETNNKVDNNQMNANVRQIVDLIKEKISRNKAAASGGLSNSLAPPPPPQQQQPSNRSAQQTPSQVSHMSSHQQQQQLPLNSPMAPILSPVTPVTPTTTGNASSFNYDFHHSSANDLHFHRNDNSLYYDNQLQLQSLKEQLQQTQQFRMPSQPPTIAQIRFQSQEQRQHQSRRHSDSSDIGCNDVSTGGVGPGGPKQQQHMSYPTSTDDDECYSSQQFNDLLRRRTQRTCSDPGSDQPLMTINTAYQPSQHHSVFGHQYYNHSHSVPTTPTVCHNSSTLQPHSLPSTPTAGAAPVNFAHSPNHSQRGSQPNTPTDATAQQFNFMTAASPINHGSVHSQYSTSPSSVAAQYSPNTPYSPSHTTVQQFTYTVPQAQPQQQQPVVTGVYEERIDDTYEDSQMYDAITDYTNTGAVAHTIADDNFNFDNNMNAGAQYFEPQNQMMADTESNMQMDDQPIEQMSIESKPQQQIQQFFSNFATANTSHEYNPIVTTTSNYVQNSNYWTQSSLTNAVHMSPQMKPQVLPQHVDQHLMPKEPTNHHMNANHCYSMSTAPVITTTSMPAHSSIVTGMSSHTPNIAYIQSSPSLHQPSLSSAGGSRHHRSAPHISSTSSPPHLVVNLEKIDECDEEGDDVFLSPVGLAPSPKRSSPAISSCVASPKRPKHRPEPLYIPPHVNTCGYQSRLRSPRLWDPSVLPDTKNLSPPPYTPPPMLSPVRSGPGLFWHIISGNMTPKSGAAIQPKFVYSRKSSSDVKEEVLSQSVAQTPTTAYEPYDCEIPETAYETDIQPHVNIGPSFQARIPAFNKNKDEAKYRTDKGDLVWDPSVAESLTADDIESYLELSCCACVPGSGRNKEYAMHLLYISNGDIQEAIVKLLEPHPTISDGHPLSDYHYPENDIWVPQEIESYQCALNKCDKDFFSIAKEVWDLLTTISIRIGTKSVKQCIQFYYMWKKVCPEEYRRLRVIRRKRENETYFYNLRSKEGEDNPTNHNNNNNGNNNSIKYETDFDADNNNDTDCLTNGGSGLGVNSAQSSDVEDNVSSFLDSANPSPATSVGSQLGDYPCKLCGKVFQKVKSRSAHMKIHGSGAAKY